MGLSSIAVQQREKEDEALKSFIVFSLVGSVGLHVAVLSMSSFWIRETKLAEEPIEVIVLDTPEVEAVKPEPKPTPKIGGGSKLSTSVKTSNTASEAKSSQPASKQEIALSPSTKVEKPANPKTTSIAKPLAAPQPTPVAMPIVTEIPPQPKVAETLPPVPTPKIDVAPTPTSKPVATLSSELITKLKSTPMPTPIPTPLVREKLKPIPSPVAVATPVLRAPQVSPSPIKRSPNVTPTRLSPRNNPLAYTPSAKKTSNTNPLNSSPSQNNVANSNKVGDRSLIPGLQNSVGSNSGKAPTNSQPGNNSTRAGNNNSGGKDKVATAPSNPTQLGEDLLTPKPGSGNLACRRCPDPAYPKRAERKGIQGTVKLVFDADRNGNIRNVRVASSSGHDILDRAATEAVKNWKLASSDSEQQGISQSFTFAKKGSDTESQARERREQQEQERLARKKEQQEQERLAREQQQRQQQEQDPPPLSTPEPLVTPSPLIEFSPFVKPSSPVPFEPSTPSSVPPE